MWSWRCQHRPVQSAKLLRRCQGRHFGLLMLPRLGESCLPHQQMNPRGGVLLAGTPRSEPKNSSQRFSGSRPRAVGYKRKRSVNFKSSFGALKALTDPDGLVLGASQPRTGRSQPRQPLVPGHSQHQLLRPETKRLRSQRVIRVHLSAQQLDELDHVEQARAASEAGQVVREPLLSDLQNSGGLVFSRPCVGPRKSHCTPRVRMLGRSRRSVYMRKMGVVDLLRVCLMVVSQCIQAGIRSSLIPRSHPECDLQP
mmetsp:Transcript_55236/g.139538  ORF Transcript_55236/g.139538 Transcript_55236/m.139538 type:complete len:254 (+) Transcript_55236:1134-1895(+)